MDQDIFTFLRGHHLFKGLLDNELSLIVAKKMTFEKGDYIIHEYEEGKYFYIIKSGSVEITKIEKSDGHEHRLTTMRNGEIFGEMVLFGSPQHSASVRALEKTEVIAISLPEFKELVHKHAGFAKVKSHLAEEMAIRLRRTSEMAVVSFDSELKLTKANAQMGHVLIHLIILMTVYFYVFKAFSQYTVETTINKIITLLLILGFAFSAAWVVKRSDYPLKFYGLTFKNWKKNIFEGVVFTIPFLIATLAFKGFLISVVPEFKNIPLFGQPVEQKTFLFFFHKNVPVEQDPLISMIIYILLVPFQEFIVRGCLQSALENFFKIPNKVLWSIFVSNLLFGMFHSFRTFSFAAFAFGFGLFWGWLYARQRSIIGPTVSHILVGVWALLFLNFQSLLLF